MLLGRLMDTAVKIRCGAVNDSLTKGVACGALVTATSDEVLLTVPLIGRYLISSSEIVVEPVGTADRATVEYFASGVSMAFLWQLRGAFVLQASAVVMPGGGAAVFCGKSSTGKSTLAAMLVKGGCVLQADEFVAIQFDESGLPWIMPGLAPSKLDRGSLNQIGCQSDLDTLLRVRPGLDLYHIPQTVSNDAVHLSCFYELAIDDAASLSCQPVKGLGRMSSILSYVHSPSVVEASGQQQAYFKSAAKLASSLPFHRIIRPQLGVPTQAVANLVKAQWS